MSTVSKCIRPTIRPPRETLPIVNSRSMSVSGSGGEVALPLYRPTDTPTERATFEIGRDPPKPDVLEQIQPDAALRDWSRRQEKRR